MKYLKSLLIWFIPTLTGFSGMALLYIVVNGEAWAIWEEASSDMKLVFAGFVFLSFSHLATSAFKETK